jgi:hypothetical protein
MSRRRSLDDVDVALEAARRDASTTRLPSALRARILAASRAAAPAPSRGRLLDFALRGAAVAAAFASVLLVAPLSLEAAEIDVRPLGEWNARLADSVARHLPSLDADDGFLPDWSRGADWAVAGAAVALVGSGLFLLRQESRR